MKSLNWSHGRLSLFVCLFVLSLLLQLTRNWFFFVKSFLQGGEKVSVFLIIKTSLHKKLLFFKMRLLLISHELLLEVSFLVFFLMMARFTFHFIFFWSVAVFVAEVAKDGMTHFQSDDIGRFRGWCFGPIFSPIQPKTCFGSGVISAETNYLGLNCRSR